MLITVIYSIIKSKLRQITNIIPQKHYCTRYFYPLGQAYQLDGQRSIFENHNNPWDKKAYSLVPKT